MHSYTCRVLTYRLGEVSTVKQCCRDLSSAAYSYFEGVTLTLHDKGKSANASTGHVSLIRMQHEMHRANIYIGAARRPESVQGVQEVQGEQKILCLANY